MKTGNGTDVEFTIGSGETSNNTCRSLATCLEERYSASMNTQKFSRMQMLILAIVTLPCSLSAADDFETLSVVADDRVSESSGLAISRNHPGCVWIHNDSGDGPLLYLVGYDGETKGIVRLIGASAIDWEDMCSFEWNGERWLLVADVGDNQEIRSGTKNGCRLYVFREPVIPRANGLPTIPWPVKTVIEMTYEDGAHNCESVAVDTKRKEILLLTKKSPQNCGLYRLPLETNRSRVIAVARRIASPFVLFATAMDISPDGSTLAVCTMLNGVVVKRTASQSWAEAVGGGGTAISFPPRRQGETICFDQQGKFLLLNSEFKQQPLYRIPVPQ